MGQASTAVGPIHKLPPEICLTIVSYCSWPSIISLSQVDRNWNNLVAERVFRSLSVKMDDSKALILSNEQRVRIQHYTRHLLIDCAKSDKSLQEALTYVQLLDSSKCLGFRLVNAPTVQYQDYQEILRMAMSMPKMSDVEIPAVYPLTNVHPSSPGSRWQQVNLKATLTLELGDHNQRHLVCTVNADDDMVDGTPSDAIVQLVSSMEKGKIRLKELALHDNGTIQCVDMMIFGGHLRYHKSANTHTLVKLELTNTNIEGIRSDLGFLNVFQLKELRIKDCEDVVQLLIYILESGRQSDLKLSCISIAGKSKEPAAARHRDTILEICDYSPLLECFEYSSDEELDHSDFDDMLFTRGYKLRRIAYRIERNIFHNELRTIFYHCPNIESLEIDAPDAEAAIDRASIDHSCGELITLCDTIHGFGLNRLSSLHMHCPKPIFKSRKSRRARKQGLPLKGCIQIVTTSLDDTMAKKAPSASRLEKVKWSIHDASRAGVDSVQTFSFGRVKELKGDALEDVWIVDE
ncbi:hypothetical protein N0V90_001141 [Kalmusia sp. IMI 367209]|nr:hypothetical protein N0V90_001141 [Kalmusia sp. IMI 367209]